MKKRNENINNIFCAIDTIFFSHLHKIYAFGVVSKGFSFVKTFITRKYRGVQMAQPNLIISRLKKSGNYQSDANRSIIKNSGSNVKNHNSRCERASYGNGNIKGLSRYFKAKQLAHRTNC